VEFPNIAVPFVVEVTKAVCPSLLLHSFCAETGPPQSNPTADVIANECGKDPTFSDECGTDRTTFTLMQIG
jgi:hypothetical protein